MDAVLTFQELLIIAPHLGKTPLGDDVVALRNFAFRSGCLVALPHFDQRRGVLRLDNVKLLVHGLRHEEVWQWIALASFDEFDRHMELPQLTPAKARDGHEQRVPFVQLRARAGGP